MVTEVFRMMAHDLVNKDELVGGKEGVGVCLPAIGKVVRGGPIVDERLTDEDLLLVRSSRKEAMIECGDGLFRRLRSQLLA